MLAYSDSRMPSSVRIAGVIFHTMSALSLTLLFITKKIEETSLCTVNINGLF